MAKISGYGAVAALRAAITEEIKAEMPEGIPFTVDHHLLVEQRLQTALMVALQNTEDEVKQVVEKKQRAKEEL